MPIINKDTFYAILTYRRPHGSETEALFCQNLTNLVESMADRIETDEVGNLYAEVGESETLFTCHVDTVHRTDGFQAIDLKDGKFTTAPGATECLGADDGAGIFIALCMIEAKVPGTYAFFRGEEVGGLGSKFAAGHRPDWLRRFKRAVAFDRGGTTDVITHQSFGRCCSDEFAEALSTALNDAGLLFMPCDRGVYTDTAELTMLIPECTNVSVGYAHQHGPGETQDWAFLEALSVACREVPWENLPTVREPHVTELLWGVGRRSTLSDSGYTIDEMIAAWEDGDNEPIIVTLADLVYPEDPEAARRYIDMTRMTSDLADRVFGEGIELLTEHLVVCS